MDSERSTVELAATQGGIVTRQQALALGMTSRQISYRVEVGRWRVHHRGVYELFTERTASDVVRAAVAALPGAVAGLDTAARLHGFSPTRDGLETVLVHTRTTHVFPGVRVVRCHDLRPSHITEIDGLRVTTIPRTIVDLSPRMPFVDLCRLVDTVVSGSPVTIADIDCVLRQVARRGRPGVAALRSILAERTGENDNMSMLEIRGLELLRRAGFEDIEIEFPMPWDPRRRFDIAFPADQLAIEWDGRFWHETAEAFQTDRERDRTALAHGWRVARFTWDEVTNAPDTVIDSIRQMRT